MDQITLPPIPIDAPPLPIINFSDDPNSEGIDNSGGGGWSEGDYAKLISTIGSTFASTFNAVNHPSYPSAYQSPTSDPGASDLTASAQTGSGGFSMSMLFEPPYVYGVIAGAAILAFMLAKR